MGECLAYIRENGGVSQWQVQMRAEGLERLAMEEELQQYAEMQRMKAQKRKDELEREQARDELLRRLCGDCNQKQLEGLMHDDCSQSVTRKGNLQAEYKIAAAGAGERDWRLQAERNRKLKVEQEEAAARLERQRV